MLVPIKNNPIFKNKDPFKIEYPSNQLKEIEENWDQFIKENPTCYNGTIFTITKFPSKIEEHTYEIGKTTYSTYMYAKKTKKINIYSLFSAIFLKTKDDYYLLVRNDNRRVNTLGGIADEKDLCNNILDLKKTLNRELKEELGLSLDNKQDIITYELKYFKKPISNEKIYPCGTVYAGILNYTKQEFQTYFNENKSNFDKEIKELLFYTKDNYLELLNEPVKASYLVEFIEKMIKEECE